MMGVGGIGCTESAVTSRLGGSEELRFRFPRSRVEPCGELGELFSRL